MHSLQKVLPLELEALLAVVLEIWKVESLVVLLDFYLCVLLSIFEVTSRIVI